MEREKEGEREGESFESMVIRPRDEDLRIGEDQYEGWRSRSPMMTEVGKGILDYSRDGALHAPFLGRLLFLEPRALS